MSPGASKQGSVIFEERVTPSAAARASKVAGDDATRGEQDGVEVGLVAGEDAGTTHVDHENSADGDPCSLESTYSQHISGVSLAAAETTEVRDEINLWLKFTNSSSNVEEVDTIHAQKVHTIQEHVASVFRATASQDYFEQRVKHIENAQLRQQQLIQQRKQERVRQKSVMSDFAKAGRPSMFGAKSSARASGLEGIVDESISEEVQPINAIMADTLLHLFWKSVQVFERQEDALKFIMKCQPYDFQPVLPKWESFPRFNTGSEAFEYVRQMETPPDEFFQSHTSAEKKRRLRIRLMRDDEELDECTVKSTLRKLGERHIKSALTFRRASRFSISAAPGEPVVMRPKRYVVEGTGGLFETPESLRGLAVAKPKVYFIALAPAVAKLVLAEGFKCKKRTSIPCCATAQEALARFKKDQEKQGREPIKFPDVLPVYLPGHIDVVQHRESGFIIRATELPPACFKERKKNES